MEMKAIQDTFGTVKAAAHHRSGKDLVLISQTGVAAANTTLVAAVKSGRISEERIDESYARVIRARATGSWGRKPGAHHHVIGSEQM